MDAGYSSEFHARHFLSARDQSLIGTNVVTPWSRTFRRGAAVIELACGGGYPITKMLDAAGLEVWAVDVSPPLVAAFHSRFPAIPVQCASVQECDFFNRKFEGAIAIGLLFLLSQADQAALTSRVSEVLVAGGRFLFTAPVEAGTWPDEITGFECVSLGGDRYTELLQIAGFRVVATCIDEGGNNYYDAQKLG